MFPNLQDVFLLEEDSMHLETVPSHIVEPESQKWFHSKLYNACIIIQSYHYITRR